MNDNVAAAVNMNNGEGRIRLKEFMFRIAITSVLPITFSATQLKLVYYSIN